LPVGTSTPGTPKPPASPAQPHRQHPPPLAHRRPAGAALAGRRRGPRRRPLRPGTRRRGGRRPRQRVRRRVHDGGAPVLRRRGRRRARHPLHAALVSRLLPRRLGVMPAGRGLRPYHRGTAAVSSQQWRRRCHMLVPRLPPRRSRPQLQRRCRIVQAGAVPRRWRRGGSEAGSRAQGDQDDAIWSRAEALPGRRAVHGSHWVLRGRTRARVRVRAGG
ncbi:hypothetical protein BAE44_0019623, partial [Dichanthelium oligosanthes]